MKKPYLLLLLLPLLIFGCGENGIISRVEEVPSCNPLLRTDWEEKVELWTGTIRYETFWVDAPDLDPESTEDVARTQISLWVMLPDEDPSMIFIPCNLPEAQKIEGREVSFSAHLLTQHVDVPEIEGTTPISIIEMEDGVEGPENEAC